MARQAQITTINLVWDQTYLEIHNLLVLVLVNRQQQIRVETMTKRMVEIPLPASSEVALLVKQPLAMLLVLQTPRSLRPTSLAIQELQAQRLSPCSASLLVQVTTAKTYLVNNLRQVAAVEVAFSATSRTPLRNLLAVFSTLELHHRRPALRVNPQRLR